MSKMTLTEKFRYENEQKIKKFTKQPQMKDKILEDLKAEFDARSKAGIKKYNTTLEDNNKDDFLQHLKEELMDAALTLTTEHHEYTQQKSLSNYTNGY